jgi:hypothetical protein
MNYEKLEIHAQSGRYRVDGYLPHSMGAGEDWTLEVDVVTIEGVEVDIDGTLTLEGGLDEKSIEILSTRRQVDNPSTTLQIESGSSDDVLRTVLDQL